MQYELNLRDYLRIFNKRKFLIIGTFVLVLAGSLYNISQQPYVYEATTSVKIEERKSIAGLLTEQIVYNPEDVMTTETKIIRGFPVMEGVAKRLGKITDQTPPDRAHEIVAGLQNQVDTRKIESTNMIEIVARGGDPKEVMDLANTTAKVYIEQNLLEKRKQASSARQFIEEQLKSLEDRLLKAEERLKASGGGAADLGMSEASQSKIVELKFQLAELSQKYTDKHPKIIQLKQQIKDLGGQVRGPEGDAIGYGPILREIEANKKLYAMLKERLEEARIQEAEKVSDISIVDPAVLPTEPIEPNKKMGLFIGIVLGLIVGVALAFFFETIDPSIGTIEDVENVIKLPVLGVVPSIRTEMEEEESPGWLGPLKSYFENLTGYHKRDKETDRYVRLFVHHKPNSLVAEAFRNIQANLKINPDGRKVFLVSSSGPGEGKTTSLINLGLTCAQSGLKTLLVSSDLRRPVVAKSFGLKRDLGLREYLEGMLDYSAAIKSVSDLVLGEMGFEEILKFPGIENISIIPSGDIPSNPAAVLAAPRLQELIQQARKEFDLILLDSPPILPIADASILAPLADSVVLVYEIGKTARHALMRAKVQVESTGVKIAGVILNNIRPRTESIMFSYPYYYKYKYAEEKEGNKDRSSAPHRDARPKDSAEAR